MPDGTTAPTDAIRSSKEAIDATNKAQAERAGKKKDVYVDANKSMGKAHGEMQGELSQRETNLKAAEEGLQKQPPVGNQEAIKRARENFDRDQELAKTIDDASKSPDDNAQAVRGKAVAMAVVQSYYEAKLKVTPDSPENKAQIEQIKAEIEAAKASITELRGAVVQSEVIITGIYIKSLAGGKLPEGFIENPTSAPILDDLAKARSQDGQARRILAERQGQIIDPKTAEAEVLKAQIEMATDPEIKRLENILKEAEAGQGDITEAKKAFFAKLKPFAIRVKKTEEDFAFAKGEVHEHHVADLAIAKFANERAAIFKAEKAESKQIEQSPDSKELQALKQQLTDLEKRFLEDKKASEEDKAKLEEMKKKGFKWYDIMIFILGTVWATISPVLGTAIPTGRTQ